MSILHDLAKSENSLERLRELLEAGEDPNSRDGAGRTPLHIASLKVVTPDDLEGNLQVARELIRYGARVDEQAINGFSPLHSAIARQKPEMVRCLLQANANVNVKNDTGQTPLMLAAQCQDFSIVKELLKKGANVNLQDNSFNTAMHYILCQPSVENSLVEELLRHRCDHTVISTGNMTPLDYYLKGLVEAPLKEVSKARDLFKLFLFQCSYFTTRQLDRINLIGQRNGMNLSQFYYDCCKEIRQIKDDFLSFDCTVYAIASLGFYYDESEMHHHISSDVYDSVTDRLIKGKYPIYRDIIVDGISTIYLRYKFSEVCSKYLNYTALSLISFHLSNLEMLKVMIAFTSN